MEDNSINRNLYVLIGTLIAAVCGVTALLAGRHTVSEVFLLAAFAGMFYLYARDNWQDLLYGGSSPSPKSGEPEAGTPAETKGPKKLAEDVRNARGRRGLPIFCGIALVIYLAVTLGSGENMMRMLIAIPVLLVAVYIARMTGGRKDGR